MVEQESKQGSNQARIPTFHGNKMGINWKWKELEMKSKINIDHWCWGRIWTFVDKKNMRGGLRWVCWYCVRITLSDSTSAPNMPTILSCCLWTAKISLNTKACRVVLLPFVFGFVHFALSSGHKLIFHGRRDTLRFDLWYQAVSVTYYLGDEHSSNIISLNEGLHTRSSDRSQQ